MVLSLFAVVALGAATPSSSAPTSSESVPRWGGQQFKRLAKLTIRRPER